MLSHSIRTAIVLLKIVGESMEKEPLMNMSTGLANIEYSIEVLKQQQLLLLLLLLLVLLLLLLLLLLLWIALGLYFDANSTPQRGCRRGVAL